MNPRAFSVVEEFLRSSDPQLRKNALTALAALGTAETIAMLVAAVLTDADSSVRARAEEELRRLGNDKRDLATRAIESALESRGVASRAYTLLGRLRGDGVWLKVRTPPAKRLKLALTARGSERGARAWAFRGRMLVAGLVTGASSLLLAALYLWWSLGWDTVAEVGDYSVIALSLAPVFAVAITWRSRPINVQYDRAAAVLVEVGWAALIGAAIIVIISAWVVLTREASAGSWLLTAIAFPGLVFGGIRGGTLLASGVWKGQVGRFAQTLAGASVGILVSSAFALTLDSRDVKEVWVMTIPALVAVAYAFSTVDARGTPTAPTFGKAALYATVPPVLLLGVALMAAVRRESLPRQPDANAARALPVIQSVESGQLVDFRIASEDTVLGVLGEGEGVSRMLDLYLWDEEGKPVDSLFATGQITSAAGPGSAFDRVLKPGVYRMMIGSSGNTAVPGSEILPSLARRLGVANQPSAHDPTGYFTLLLAVGDSLPSLEAFRSYRVGRLIADAGTGFTSSWHLPAALRAFVLADKTTRGTSPSLDAWAELCARALDRTDITIGTVSCLHAGPPWDSRLTQFVNRNSPVGNVLPGTLRNRQTWAGYYHCAQGKTDLELRITSVSGTRMSAVFAFDYDKRDVGSYNVQGEYNPETARLVFTPTSWVRQPPGYVAVGMDGHLSSNGKVYQGRITNASCGDFELTPRQGIAER